ncbi:glycoside hydrolase 100 family protein [Pedobacter vanadiisoli]|uniref:beta-fructofuranosidase n=1 Tax=Pedobacter vanadiisoli TaxID=1761975 RepID=A0ABW5MPK2_9SPHI
MENKHLYEKAVGVVSGAVQNGVLLASAEAKDNYSHVWARDSVVTGLGILSNGLSDLYSVFLKSLKVLQQAASGSGQIPSNVAINQQGEIIKISFGGTAGRTDASFWWLIGSISYLQHQQDQDFYQVVKEQAKLIFELADHWEFNGKHLMYVPMSSNWADEYITHGYVLYDQLLRYWALSLAGSFFNEAIYTEKAAFVKSAIKRHYLFEQPLDNSLYTVAQQKTLATYRLENNFIASFSPGDRVERYDGWSIGLLLLLNIPSAESRQKLAVKLEQTLSHYGHIGIPAFWPEIENTDPSYAQLLNNYSFNFKNRPGHFHNGGIWPVVNGFIAAGLVVAGFTDLAKKLRNSIVTCLSSSEQERPFSEYYDIRAGKAGGVKNLCFSALGYLLADVSVNHPEMLHKLLPALVNQHIYAHQAFKMCASRILKGLPIPKDGVLVVSIAGESGCGKTTLSSALKEVLQNQGYETVLLHQDDYFRLPPRKNHEERLRNFDHIGYTEVDAEKLNQDIITLRRGQASQIEVPYMNWFTDELEHQELPLHNLRVVIVEGTYTSMLSEVDYRIFINTSYQQTHENRLERSREAIDDFTEKVLQKESVLIQAHANLADIIINKKLEILSTTPH